jgi:hypothetical protein
MNYLSSFGHAINVDYLLFYMIYWLPHATIAVFASALVLSFILKSPKKVIIAAEGIALLSVALISGSLGEFAIAAFSSAGAAASAILLLINLIINWATRKPEYCEIDLGDHSINDGAKSSG